MARGGARPGAGRKPGALNKATANVKLLAQQWGEQVIQALAEIATGAEQPPAARVAAANALLDRGYGKATQALELSGSGGGPMEHVGMTPAEFEKIARRVASDV